MVKRFDLTLTTSGKKSSDRLKRRQTWNACVRLSSTPFIFMIRQSIWGFHNIGIIGIIIARDIHWKVASAKSYFKWAKHANECNYSATQIFINWWVLWISEQKILFRFEEDDKRWCYECCYIHKVHFALWANRSKFERKRSLKTSVKSSQRVNCCCDASWSWENF